MPIGNTWLKPGAHKRNLLSYWPQETESSATFSPLATAHTCAFVSAFLLSNIPCDRLLSLEVFDGGHTVNVTCYDYLFLLVDQSFKLSCLLGVSAHGETSITRRRKHQTRHIFSLRPLLPQIPPKLHRTRGKELSCSPRIVDSSANSSRVRQASGGLSDSVFKVCVVMTS